MLYLVAGSKVPDDTNGKVDTSDDTGDKSANDDTVVKDAPLANDDTVPP